jgi:para-aminobenzoate synthetase component 1
MQKSSLIIKPVPAATQDSLLSIFESVSEQPWSLLIDSAGSGKQSNRFDILLHSPKYTITTRGNATSIVNCENRAQKLSFADPISEAQSLHNLLVSQVQQINGEFPSELPFIIGIAGLFGYDLGRRFEQLPTPYESEYKCPDMALGVYHRSLILDKRDGILYDCRLDHLPPFELDKSNETLCSGENTEEFRLTSDWHSNFEKNAYLDGLRQINNYLQAGDCYQVNFAQRFTAKYQGNEWQAYLKLREANKAPYSAFLRLPSSSILSISPERFISVKQSKVQTKPIKGTRPRDDDPITDKNNAEELLSSEKDRAENLMIVDLLRNDISKHCKPHSVKVPHAFSLESYAAVHHMVTTIEGELDAESNPFSLLRDAFPGGSITGAPKIRAQQIIDELEPNGRNIYCGSIGYVGIRNDMDTSICIRTLLCENNNVHCWAGGGIVLDSDPESEYQETLDKVNKILPVLS